MEETLQEFFKGFHQGLLAGAEGNSRSELEEFMMTISDDLEEAGFIENFTFCHYHHQKSIRVDGYNFNEDGQLDLFIADFDSRTEVKTLAQTELKALFKRLTAFLEECFDGKLARSLELSCPEYDLAHEIANRQDAISGVRLFVLSERALSSSLTQIPSGHAAGIPVEHDVWDINRIWRQRSSASRKEVLDLDLIGRFGKGIPCLPACLPNDTYRSYLAVMPAEMLADLYAAHGPRLLEQNVRTFLQVKGRVNKGIQATIRDAPDMFFAYNNGISATAQLVETSQDENGLSITRVVDLQIVNGGQTTASLQFAAKNQKAAGKADLSRVFVPMKLSVIEASAGDEVVPNISRYANTQNRISTADFFSNHPFHVRMQDISRRLWAPALAGALRETRWFYERTRGQYAEAVNRRTSSDRNRFIAEHPKHQVFSKTDLAKFENVWDEHPKWVNLGAQKNFAKYAERIGKDWKSSPDLFNELYFKRAVARAIIFRAAERLVSEQEWYKGGYRANIVAYTLAMLSLIARDSRHHINFLQVWQDQRPSSSMMEAMKIVAAYVHDVIRKEGEKFGNVSEWCKKEGCWDSLRPEKEKIRSTLPKDFLDSLVSDEDQQCLETSARKSQKMDNGIEAQQRVMEISSTAWTDITHALRKANRLGIKEEKLLRVAVAIPKMVPTEKQSLGLLEVLDKARTEGLLPTSLR